MPRASIWTRGMTLTWRRSPSTPPGKSHNPGPHTCSWHSAFRASTSDPPSWPPVPLGPPRTANTRHRIPRPGRTSLFRSNRPSHRRWLEQPLPPPPSPAHRPPPPVSSPARHHPWLRHLSKLGKCYPDRRRPPTRVRQPEQSLTLESRASYLILLPI